MNGLLGSTGVLLGFAASVSGVLTLAVGLRRRQPRLLQRSGLHARLVFLGAVLAVLAMERALVGHDFSLRYVAENGSRHTPLLYTVASLWAALAGSILLWALVLSGYLVAVGRQFRHRLSDPVVAWAMLVMLVVAAFFFGLLLGPANPFHHVVGAIPLDGPGPNPLLQNHPLMAIHPPMLYLGYVGFTVPFAFAVAALVTGRTHEGWMAETRRWTLLAWGCLGTGIVLGSWWSYEVLGWGGYWAWDPVENAAFLPWLTATAYLHSVIVQERRGMLRVWNFSLLAGTFALTIFGTFLTRSGILESVHSFSRSAIGPMLLGFFAAVVAVSVGLVAWRGDRLRSAGEMDSPLSQQASFLANNLLLAGFAFVVLLGTIFPEVAEALHGDRISVGRPYFDRMAVPIGLALLLLMAVGPALPWHRSSGEVLRRRLQWPAWLGTAAVVAAVALGARGVVPVAALGLAAFAGGSALRHLALSVRRQGVGGLMGRTGGGMVAHLGVVLIAAGVAASGSYARAGEFRLRPGQSARLGGHSITYLGTDVVDSADREVLRARVRIDGGRAYAPRLTVVNSSSQPIGTPSVRSTLIDDVYLRLQSAPTDPGGEAVIGLIVQPMVVYLWIGGALMALGTILAAWPTSRRRRIPPAAEPAVAADERVAVGVA